VLRELRARRSGIKVDVAGYSDTFPAGPAAYCQPASSTAGIACGTGLTFQATGRASYVTAGPEWKIRRGKRFAPCAQALVGIVYTRSTFMMNGSDVQSTSPFTGGVLLFTVEGSSNFLQLQRNLPSCRTLSVRACGRAT
jgi:hypothetical protein